MTTQPARATVTAKGQLTLRRGLLDHIGVRPGERVDLVPLPNGRLELRPVRDETLDSLFGILKRPGQPTVTIEEMNESIAQGWAGTLNQND